MAGILNNKERMIDFIITPQGRRQMADGRMRIEYATLTDLHAFYRTTRPGGIADDASERIYFEAAPLSCDLIAPELEGGTVMQPFEAGQLNVNGMKLAAKTFTTASMMPFQGLTVLTGTQVLQRSEELVSTIGSHFASQKILNTHDPFSNTSEFKVNFLTGSFIITKHDLLTNHGKGIYLKDVTIDNSADGILELDNMPSIYGDERFGHLPNFRYLPPVNVADPGETSVALGTYPRLSEGLGSASQNGPQGIGETNVFGETDFGHNIGIGSNSVSKNVLNLDARQKVVINFQDISRDKNLVSQIFEFRDNGECEKLSAIDYGIVEYQRSEVDLESGLDIIKTFYAHYYFIGKIVKDSKGVDHWINIFTLKFCDDDLPGETILPATNQDKTQESLTPNPGGFY